MTSNVYTKQPNLVFGFHGCKKDIIQDIVLSNSKHLNKSNNSFDWLGSGVYFWQNDPQRAFEWAQQKFGSDAGVIGAVIDLGECLDLCERTSIDLVKYAHSLLQEDRKKEAIEMEVNKVNDDGGFKLVRYLDCAVIEYLHTIIGDDKAFDTVKGYFQEGKEVYEGAGIRMRSHIQICVRNMSNIKAYFVPRIK